MEPYGQPEFITEDKTQAQTADFKVYFFTLMSFELDSKCTIKDILAETPNLIFGFLSIFLLHIYPQSSVPAMQSNTAINMFS